MGAAIPSQSGLFYTAHSGKLQFPCKCLADCSLRHFPFRKLFPRARRALWGLIAGYRNPAHFHLSPHRCPGATEAVRGLRLPACFARTPVNVPR